MKPALFFHTQKTAGTAIQVMARCHYGKRNVISHGDYVNLGQKVCHDFPFVSGHFGFSFAEPLMEGRYCFTFLREPIQRILSLYTFALTQPSKFPFYAAAQKLGLEGLLRLGEQPKAMARREPFAFFLWNHQVWQLAYGRDAALGGEEQREIWDFSPEELLAAAKCNLDRFDKIGFVETFDEDVRAIFADLGFPDIEPVRANESKRRVEPSDLTHEAARLLESYSYLDRELYDYAKRRTVTSAA